MRAGLVFSCESLYIFERNAHMINVVFNRINGELYVTELREYFVLCASNFYIIWSLNSLKKTVLR